MSVLEVDGVTKTYRNGVKANDAVSLTVGAGEVFGLLGPNGAGKTTLVRQILGVLRPDRGRIAIDGRDIAADRQAARALCSYQPQAAAPVEGLSPWEATELIGRIRGGEKTSVRQRTDQLLAGLDLTEAAERRATMSGGMARLTGFCMAAVVPGRVVILDEPTNDVDPLRRRRLWDQVRALADDGAAVLLVTHNVLEAERCVDRLAIVGGGRVLASGTPAALKAALGAPLRLECTLEAGMDLPPPPPEVMFGVPVGRRVVGHVDLRGVSGAVAWATAARNDGVLTEFSLTPASLEDVYANWVTSEEAQ